MTAPAATSTWNIDPAHSVAEFKVRHMMISNVKGTFPKMSGALTLDEANLHSSHIEAVIDVSSISTGEPQRDGHLKSPDFFDAEKFPTMSFKSTNIAQAGDGQLAVTGGLTIRDVTRSVEFAVEGPTVPMTDPYGNTRVAVAATTKISRKEFGLVYSPTLETGGLLIGDEITITLDIQFIKAA
jgi:polyisoprenoid-binding protein YceI